MQLLVGRGVAEVRTIGRTSEIRKKPSNIADTPLGETAFDGLDVVFFCTPAEVSRTWVPVAAKSGSLVIDNSSAFRMDPETPLIIPEVNGERLTAETAIVANPNCSTILLLVALAPIHRAYGSERVSVSTYQAVSGAGRRAIEELDEAARSDLAGEEHLGEVFDEPVAFNVFSHDSPVDPATGRNGEEEKIVREVERILERPPRVAATCVRVPVRRSHCEAVQIALRRYASEKEVRDVLRRAPGVVLVDDREAGKFPTARGAEGEALVSVGRLRIDRSHDTLSAKRGRGVERSRHFQLFLAGDQLLKGAALNALQIAELAWPLRERRLGTG